MTTASLELSKTAPALYPVRGSTWQWVSLAEITEVFHMEAHELWQLYCDDAAEAAREDDWDGRNWKYAIASGNNQQILNVWNMKTGECFNPDLSTLGNGVQILLPAGWSRLKSRETHMVEEAILAAFMAVSRCMNSTHGVPAADSQNQSDALATVSSAFARVNRYSSLGFVLAQLSALNKPFDVRTSEDMEINTVTLKIGSRALCPAWIKVTIRLVLGTLKVLRVEPERRQNND
jgi:hypothetical protein